MKLNNLKLGPRLAFGYGIVCLALIASLVFGLRALSASNERSNDIVTTDMIKIELSNNVFDNTNAIGLALRNLMLNDDETDNALQLQVIAAARETIAADNAKLDAIITAPDEREQFVKVVESGGKYLRAQEQLVGLIQAGEADAARTFLSGTIRPIFESYKGALRAQLAQFNTQLGDAIETSNADYRTTRNMSPPLAC